LEEIFKVLADNPLTGIAREDLQPPRLRSFVHGSHVVFCQQQPYGVLIVHAPHGRQDVREYLGSGYVCQRVLWMFSLKPVAFK
jgi:plasmid stabilization system protein ParE